MGWVKPFAFLGAPLGVLFVVVAVGSLLTGCKSETPGSYATEIDTRLKPEGFETWFPPEEGVEVGQIWSIDLAGNRELAFARPTGLPQPPEHPADFVATAPRNLTLPPAAALRLADTVVRTPGQGPDAVVAGPDDGTLWAALMAASVESAVVDLGQPFQRDMGPADLDAPGLTSGPYRSSLSAARVGSPRHVCVASVVEVAGLTCTWTVSDSTPVSAALPRLTAALGSKVALSVVDKCTVRLRVPESRRLAVAVRRLTGGAGFAPPASPAIVQFNLNHLAGFDAEAGVRLGRDGAVWSGYADRKAFDGWLAAFRPQPGVTERVAALRSAVAAATDVTEPGPPPKTYPGTVRLSYRDVTTLLDVQRLVTNEAVRRGLADVDEIRAKAHIGQ